MGGVRVYGDERGEGVERMRELVKDGGVEGMGGRGSGRDESLGPEE